MSPHRRAVIVSKAELKLVEFLIAWRARHGLTFAEYVGALGRAIATAAKYAGRAARHGDPSKKGREA